MEPGMKRFELLPNVNTDATVNMCKGKFVSLEHVYSKHHFGASMNAA